MSNRVLPLDDTKSAESAENQEIPSGDSKPTHSKENHAAPLEDTRHSRPSAGESHDLSLNDSKLESSKYNQVPLLESAASRLSAGKNQGQHRDTKFTSDGDKAEVKKDENFTKSGESKSVGDQNPQARVWWGDLLPREDGTCRAAIPHFSDIDFNSGRGQWASKTEFLLSCLGLCVGLGNVWRFPYLAYENGGAAFIVAYIILQLCVGKPMYFLELAVSQFSGKGPTKVWDMHPAAKGVGIAMCIVTLNTTIYYNVIMCYTLSYLFAAMQRTLPWTVCQEDWVKEDNCVAERFPDCTPHWKTESGSCVCTGNATIDRALPVKCVEKVVNATTAAELYFYRSVIQLSPGLEPENIGTPIPRLAGCLLLSSTVVVFCLIKGIKSSGKVVYFTATFPYVILMTLLIRGFLLDGALDGAYYFLVPSWSKLKDVNVWAAAAGQMFFSLTVAFGGIFMFGSYNRFNNNVYTDTLIVANMDLVTSIIGGLVVFTTFGVMAKSIGSTVENVARSGYGLAFVVYPEALSRMPLTHMWSLFFFFMLFTLGLDSEFGFMETLMTAMQDELPKMRLYKGPVVVAVGVACYLLALPCVCPGGDYVVTLMDRYGSDFAVLCLAFWEAVALSWGYGARQILQDLDYMVGSRPHLWQYWLFCWVVVCPVVLAALFTNRMIFYKPPRYPTGLPFPQFAQNIGWAICTINLCAIPLWFFYLVVKSFKTPGIITWEQRKKFLFYPNRHWMPNDGRTEMI
ncbi:transporter [Elysia marginata]|uniref:Transporter n=1 Tax=Elysia marginata TaxID=1093978 RepID=A0AAV4I512_9GAST|nr:transporter [Elysia marginata]